MIFVERSRVAEPASLSRTNDDGKTETDHAIEHYTIGWDGKKAFPFSRYKENEVKAKLEELFDGKCAYCESRFRHVAPEDVEHWRPKGAVQLADGSEKKPGYYWLAATWSNLLPSCIDCNRRRRQVDVGHPEQEQSGKESLFPVGDEILRWTRHDLPDGETPLLLNPCVDDPSRYLQVVEVEKKTVVKELQPAGTLENRRAEQTIAVFGLNRTNLVDERDEQRLLLLGFLDEARKYCAHLDRLPADPAVDPVRTDIRAMLIGKLAQIKTEIQPRRPYLMMKRPIVDGFMAELGPALRRHGII